MGFFFRPRSDYDQLLDGYRRFRRTTFAKDRKLYERLRLKGQHPKLMMIACSDSRVSPTAIFGLHPGEAFIARNIANIVPPHDPDAKPRSVAACIEFAIKVLSIEHLIVLGHANCAGCAALVFGAGNLPQTDYVAPWVEVAAPARERLRGSEDLPQDERAKRGEQAVIRLSIDNLMQYPWVHERARARRLHLHGMRFDMGSGELTTLDTATGDFKIVG